MHEFTTGGLICFCLLLLGFGFILGWYLTKAYYENIINLLSPDWKKLVEKAIDKVTNILEKK
jgi:hypothetical protein